MATRAAAHAAGPDVPPTAPTANPNAPLGSANDAASNAPLATTHFAPQATIDASAYEPSTPSISAYANAAAVAASTAMLTPAPGASAISTATRGRAAVAASPSLEMLPSSASSLPTTPTQTPSISTTLAPPVALLARSSAGRLPNGRPSSKFGTVNYSVDEMRRLNEKVRAVMPIASDDWLHVAYQFNYMRPESIPYREVESLKRKFKKMYCTRVTGGSKLPDYAQQAKELRKQINQRTERAQIQLESVHSDSQSEIDAPDGVPNMESASGNGGHGDGIVLPSTSGAEMEPSTSMAMDTAELSASASATNASVDPATNEMSTEGEAAIAGGVDDTRDIAARLRLMEDEYHQSMAAKRGSATATTMPTTSSADALSASGLGGGALYVDSPAIAVSLNGDATTTTTGIIHLLKHSIERKRRTIEEQMLSESERVRKERKKRKMEQVLYNIHREQTGYGDASGSTVASTSTSAGAFQHNLLATTGAAATAASPSPSASGGSGMLPTAVAPPCALTGPVDASTSLGVMEIVLQYLIAQQQETSRREQQEHERRRIEDEERARRRRHKDAQRRKDKHEMMLVMAALLQENFPVELRQYLDPTASAGPHSDATGHDSSSINGVTTSAKPKASSEAAIAMGATIDRAGVEEDALL